MRGAGRTDFGLVVVGLGGVGDEEDHQVRLLDDLLMREATAASACGWGVCATGVAAGAGAGAGQRGTHVVLLAEGALALVEANLLGGRPRGGALAEADRDRDVRADLLQRVREVLGLRGRLGAPADHADLLDALERLGDERELVAAALRETEAAGLGA